MTRFLTLFTLACAFAVTSLAAQAQPYDHDHHRVVRHYHHHYYHHVVVRHDAR